MGKKVTPLPGMHICFAYLQKDEVLLLTIREMIEGDIKALTRAFSTPLTWWNTRKQYQRYWQEQQSGQRVVLVAWCDKGIAGYTNVLWGAQYPGFQSSGIPEINDLVVPSRYRRAGIGTALMDKAEQLIAKEGHAVVGLGCGDTLHYAAARHLYAKRGYCPEDSGPQKTPWGMMTYMTKKLSPTR